MKTPIMVASRLSAVVLAGVMFAQADATSALDLKAFEAQVRQTRVIELPDVLSKAIRQTPSASRTQSASELLSAAMRVHPTSSTKLLSAAIKANPDGAVALTETAVRLQPENSAALVSVAMDAAPAHRDALASVLQESNGVSRGTAVAAAGSEVSSKVAAGTGGAEKRFSVRSGGGSRTPGQGGTPPGQGGSIPSGKKPKPNP